MHSLLPFLTHSIDEVEKKKPSRKYINFDIYNHLSTHTHTEHLQFKVSFMWVCARARFCSPFVCSFTLLHLIKLAFGNWHFIKEKKKDEKRKPQCWVGIMFFCSVLFRFSFFFFFFKILHHFCLEIIKTTTTEQTNIVYACSFACLAHASIKMYIFAHINTP